MGARRLAALLAERLRETGQEPEATLSVAELHRELLPYPRCREAAGFATKPEYDLAMLDLLRDGRWLRVTEEELARAVEKELAAPEPGLAFLRDFAAVKLETRVAELTGTGTAGADGEEATGPSDGDAPDSAEDPAAEDPAAEAPAARTEAWLDGLEEDAPRCRTCKEILPRREDLRYCPFCGGDQRVPTCDGCGTELEPAWSFCPRCGAEREPADEASGV